MATVFRNGRKLGEYLIQNLSAGGALLVKGPPVRVGSQLLLALQGVESEPLGASAVVVRVGMIANGEPAMAVEFQSLSEPQVRLLERLVTVTHEHEHLPAVLVFHRNHSSLAWMARDIVALRRRPLLAIDELDLVRHLGDAGARLCAIVVDTSREPASAFEALDLVRERYPSLQRIAVCERGRAHERELALSKADALLDAPWSREGLRSALRLRTLSAAPQRFVHSEPP